ncbi:zinc finger CCCH-type with G patch domain-containing protein [Esox lucius]|uniref:Zinc finger CCCH-type with G patch domain-containing protein n=1 Tax=Esox lucius TaxID=8010 RepID=A0A3P8XCN5_ESOLU|nr:zinc finger CCCH-type with G patch domain-containing protein [Esox lucius]XP_010874081.2 zinc finger CCCH-type with G patch domain-containing protein [Esox lucius]
MDEHTLEAAIAAYGTQLQQVECALSAGLDPSQQVDLIKLKDDLSQLIELTEASLVSVKKSRLLATLEEANGLQSLATDDPANCSLDNEFAAFYSEMGEVSRSSSDPRDEGNQMDDVGERDDDGEHEEGEVETLSGTKVRAPYRTSWGRLEYHNAMIVGTERCDTDEPQVRVLYVHPTQKSMKPCPFFLEDKCRFEDNCRFSHGEVVYVSELRDFLESDLSNLQKGSSCLARQEDGIWYPAKITDIDSEFYTVKFDSALLKSAVVEADGVIPPLREDDVPSSSGSEDDDNGVEETAFARVLTQEEDWASSSSSSFGGWEAHTRGIGSKLMLKMGYEYGKGLGKTSEGRVEPVLVVVLPKGKSPDQCAELTGRKTQSKAAKDGQQVICKKRTRKARMCNLGGKNNVFDFLNRKLGDGDANPKAGGTASLPLPRNPLSRGAGVEAYKGGKSTKRSLNVKLFQASERVAQTEREIQRLTESLSRHTGRDSAVLARLEEKLSSARSLLAQQKAQELTAQRENRKADTHKKMTEF